MPFASRKQEKYLFSQKPDIARRFVADAKRAHEPMISAADIDLYRRQLAQHYADMDLARGRHVAAADIDFNAVRAGLNAPPPVGAPAAPPPTGVTLDPSAQFQVGSPDPLAHPQTASLQQINDASQAGLPTPRDLDFVVAAKTNAGGKYDKALGEPPGPVKPGDVALAQPTQGGVASRQAGYDSGFIPAPSARGGVATIPAHEVALVDPNRIAQMGGDEALVQKAIGQKGDVDAAIANEQGAAANVRALQQKADALDEQNYGAKLDADFQKKTAARDAYANATADMHKDPGRWLKNQSTANRIRFALAAALGGFAQGMHATRTNVAMDQINRYISDDLDAQQSEIEAHKAHLAQMNGALADAYRQTGDMKAARHLAHEQLLDAFDQEQKGYALKTGSQTAIANSNLLSAQAQLHKDQQQASYYSYQPERKVAAGAVDPRIKAAEDTAKHLVEQGYAPEDARRRAYAGAGLIYAPDIGEHSKPGQSSDERYQKYKDDLLAKNQIPLSRGEWDKAQAGTSPTGPGANVPRPESVAYNPTRFVQGTDAYKKELQQGNYNAAVYRAVFQRYPVGIDRSAAAQKAILDKFLIHPGDIQSTIDQKLQAAQSELGLGVGGGGGGDSGGGVQVTPETGD